MWLQRGRPGPPDPALAGPAGMSLHGSADRLTAVRGVARRGEGEGGWDLVNETGSAAGRWECASDPRRSSKGHRSREPVVAALEMPPRESSVASALSDLSCMSASHLASKLSPCEQKS